MARVRREGISVTGSRGIQRHPAIMSLTATTNTLDRLAASLRLTPDVRWRGIKPESPFEPASFAHHLDNL